MSVLQPILQPICGPILRGIADKGAGGVSAMQLLESWSPPTDATAYLWRSYDTNVDTMEMWARSDNSGHFTIAQFKSYNSALQTIGRLREGAVGTTVHHSSGTVTKTGTWANSANTGAFNGSSSQSSTAGNTIACSVTGSTLGLRVVGITNGGYSTVAIDGDYTAADELPAVTQALIDAGKFQQAQLGHRYLNCYANTSSTDFWDYHVLLTEKASNAAHTITVKVAGTAEGGTGNRTYVTAFVGCTMAQSPGDAGTAMFHVRDVTSSDNGQVSSMTLAWQITPTGYDPEDSGDNHGNESLVSNAWAVDGVAPTLALNQIVSGSEITFSRVITTTHPVAGNVANKTDVFSCRGDRKYQIQYDWSTTFILPGTIGFAYCGMLNHFMNYAPIGDKFSAYVVGAGAIGRLTGSGAQNGKLKTTVAGFLDPSHDTIGTVTVPDPATSLNNWTYSQFFVWASDIAANRKIYFTRALGSGTFEPVVADQVLHGSCAWRTFRLPGGYSRLSGLIGP